MVSAAILGATGYGGVELVRLLQSHPEVRLSYLHSESYAGQRACDVYPHLAGVETRLRALDAEAVAAACQVALMALPAGMSREVVPALLARGLRVVDVGPDFRLRSAAAYPRWYQFEHEHPELLAEAAFGLPEWHRDQIAVARLTAAPGCYSTVAILALSPLVADGLIDPSDIIVDGKTGVSGAGRTKLTLPYHYPEADADTCAYSVGGHRHMPEMVQELQALTGEPVRLTFTPHLVPMVRGILLTCYAKPRPGADAAALRESLARRYDREPFVHVLPEGQWPHTKWTTGTNHCFLAAGVSEDTGRAIVVAAIDNIGKGMSGQMVQCLNLMLGVSETTCLDARAAYP
jgi:N-acetyl-gamma-glutamyl-phosphate reductase